MERILTRDVGRYKMGDIFDWPKPTWDQIAAHFNKSMSAFSKPVEDVAKRAVAERRARA